MAENPKKNRPKARLAKGFRDVEAQEIRGLRAMLAKIQQVYESYGFEPVEQPFVEYTEALGKFLPDQDRPNAGVFSFQDEDEQWLSLRYDLTAPLARYVAENQQFLPTPYRSYRQGYVFRNEKPGPGRFRQFMQFDADTVGSASPAADAEVCMMAADTMEALGLKRGQYVVKVNSRRTMDALLANVGIDSAGDGERRLTVLRAMDKLDRLGIEGVKLLLGKGRKDESGDFTKGAELPDTAIATIAAFLMARSDTGNEDTIAAVEKTILRDTANDGLAELSAIAKLVREAGYGADRIIIDPSVVRGLEYYTGPVFECELLLETKDEDGRPVRFGSVGGGGRYDDLVARFTGQTVPATGFSIGVSRLYSALRLAKPESLTEAEGPVVVLVMDKDRQADYWRMVQSLRAAGVRAEMYVGTAGMKAQMKYADKRKAPLVVIQGGDEKAAGVVQVKDLRLGAALAANIESREEYQSQRLAQLSAPEAELVKTVQEMLARGR